MVGKVTLGLAQCQRAGQGLENTVSGCVCGHERLTVFLLMVAVLIPATLLAQDQEDLVRRSLPLLSEKVGSLDQSIFPAFLKYAALVLKPDWIKTDDDLGSLFKERESIVKIISGSEPLCKFFSEETEQWYYKKESGNWDKYEREFDRIGLTSIIAEGMFAGLAGGPVLNEVVNRVASEPYRLLIRLTDAYAESNGGEYTYMNLGAEMKAIELGEMFLTQYPDSKYVDAAKQILSQALFPLTDWHVILSTDPIATDKTDYHPFCIVGDLSTEAYPNWTDIRQPKEFIETYPLSIFHDVVARIVNEPSEILAGKPIHVVVTDEFSEERLAQKAILSYFLKGLDVPHLINLAGNSYIVAYRFFADPEKAKKALEKIRQTEPEAVIRELHRPG